MANSAVKDKEVKDMKNYCVLSKKYGSDVFQSREYFSKIDIDDYTNEITNFDNAKEIAIQNATKWLDYLKKSRKDDSIFYMVVVDEPEKFAIRMVLPGRFSGDNRITLGLIDVMTMEDGWWRSNSVSKKLRESWVFEEEP